MNARVLARLGASLLFAILASCGGDNTNGRLNVIPDSITLGKGASVEVAFELAGSQGLVNQPVHFSVSDPQLAHVTPSSCVVSSGSSHASSCMLTVTGKNTGTVSLIAAAPGYASEHTLMSIANPNPYGTLSVTPSSDASQTYYVQGRLIPFAITVQLAPVQGGQSIPQSNPLTVSMNQPAGAPFTFTAQQCSLWTTSPTCSISGTLDATKVSPAGFSSTIGVVGAWQVPPLPFGAADNMTINWTGSSVQQPGSITVSSQNRSNQVYTGMRAPLFVNLDGNTLNTSSYQVRVTSNNPAKLVFYQFPDGTNDLTSIALHTMNSVTCSLSLDNTSIASLQSSITSCGYGLYPKASGSASFTVSVTGTSAPAAPMPTHARTVHVLITDASLLSTGRTITFMNNSATDTVVVAANSGTANAYTSAVSVASGGDFTNPARSIAGGQSQCGPTNPRNACPIGSTCVQGGQTIAAGNGTPFYCYWDAPVFTSATQTTPANKLPPNSSATLFIPSWSGITSGAQQVQWSGNYYVKKCAGGICPVPPSTPGTGSSYAAETLAEVTYQHNAVDYYDVSIINGANYAMQFGPSAAERTPDPANAYTCGTAGSMSSMAGTPATNPGGYLPASTWAFSPGAANFPTGVNIADSPSSYYAVVEPALPVATSCSLQSDCAAAGSSGPQCGWDYSQVVTGTFAFSARVCGTFHSWATADQVYGWNNTATNMAPFSLQTALAVAPAFNAQSSVSVGDLQLCVNNTYSSYTTPKPANQPDGTVNMSHALACGGTDWVGVTRPSTAYTTLNPDWVSYVLPTISWLKAACPTCYTYPYDDMSSTFTCARNLNALGGNTLNYTIQINNINNTFN